MTVYRFKADNHRRGQEDRNNRPYIAYEYNSKYHVCLLSSDGEYIGQAKNIDCNNPLHAPSTNLSPGFSLQTYAENFGSWFDPPLNIISFEEIEAKPGVLSRRIWRPCKAHFEKENYILDVSDMSDVSDVLVDLDLAEFKQSVVSLNGIVRKLKELFYTVEPTPNNNGVYGHELRNLLLLASMEVEAAFVGVLSANNYSGERWSTNDYVKLLGIYDLSHWKANFPLYPNYGDIIPFKGWESENPTKSLKWYDSYNKTKHNRENNFSHANFENVINSVCAAVILLHAQFGFRREFHLSNLADISITPPCDHFVKEFYIPLLSENSQSWKIQNFNI